MHSYCTKPSSYDALAHQLAFVFIFPDVLFLDNFSYYSYSFFFFFFYLDEGSTHLVLQYLRVPSTSNFFIETST